MESQEKWLHWSWKTPKTLEDELEAEQIFARLFDTLRQRFLRQTTILSYDSREDMGKEIIALYDVAAELVIAFSDLVVEAHIDEEYTVQRMLDLMEAGRPRFGVEEGE